MSVRVVLDHAKVEEHGEKQTDRKHGYITYQYHGIQIHPDAQGTYISLYTSPLGVEVNPVIPRDFILYFTSDEFIGSEVLRPEGRYIHKGAVGFIRDSMRGRGDSRSGYWLYIKADALEDLKEMYEQIRTGQLKPEVLYDQPVRETPEATTASAVTPVSAPPATFRRRVESLLQSATRRLRGKQQIR